MFIKENQIPKLRVNGSTANLDILDAVRELKKNKDRKRTSVWLKQFVQLIYKTSVENMFLIITYKKFTVTVDIHPVITTYDTISVLYPLI